MKHIANKITLIRTLNSSKGQSHVRDFEETDKDTVNYLHLSVNITLISPVVK